MLLLLQNFRVRVLFCCLHVFFDALLFESSDPHETEISHDQTERTATHIVNELKQIVSVRDGIRRQPEKKEKEKKKKKSKHELKKQ